MDGKIWTWTSRKSSCRGDLSDQKWLIAVTRLGCTSLMKDFRLWFYGPLAALKARTSVLGLILAVTGSQCRELSKGGK